MLEMKIYVLDQQGFHAYETVPNEFHPYESHLFSLVLIALPCSVWNSLSSSRPKICSPGGRKNKFLELINCITMMRSFERLRSSACVVRRLRQRHRISVDAQQAANAERLAVGVPAQRLRGTRSPAPASGARPPCWRPCTAWRRCTPAAPAGTSTLRRSGWHTAPRPGRSRTGRWRSARLPFATLTLKKVMFLTEPTPPYELDESSWVLYAVVCW
jgi:hypothetical protein